jgi:hypothetical protein
MSNHGRRNIPLNGAIDLSQQKARDEQMNMQIRAMVADCAARLCGPMLALVLQDAKVEYAKRVDGMSADDAANEDLEIDVELAVELSLTAAKKILLGCGMMKEV